MSLFNRVPRNARIALACFAVVGGMLLLVAWSLPLYRAFCEATGLGGTTRRAAGAGHQIDRTITVRFNTEVAPGLPWRFAPSQPQVTVRLGEPTLVTFWAENLADEPIVGHATYNVTPDLAGQFFNKIQCFCFDEERLEPHKRVEMPVTFFVDAAMADDKDMGSLPTITLSYTFFRSKTPDAARDLSRLGPSATVAPQAIVADATRGATLFQARCTACHALDRDRIGPRLGGLDGRRAGSVDGFGYTSGLAASGLVWDRATLERWLAGPGEVVPGTRMMMRVESPQDRADIAAYLLAPRS